MGWVEFKNEDGVPYQWAWNPLIITAARLPVRYFIENPGPCCWVFPNNVGSVSAYSTVKIVASKGFPPRRSPNRGPGTFVEGDRTDPFSG